MARKPTSSQLTKFADEQTDVMGDICNITRITTAVGTYSDDEVLTSTGTLSLPCGFYFTNKQINSGGELKLVDYDAVLRLPTTQTINMSDQIALVKHGGVGVSGTFQPFSAPDMGISALTVKLKRVV